MCIRDRNGCDGATGSLVGNVDRDGIGSRPGPAAGLAASSTEGVDAVAGSPDSGWLSSASTSIISSGVRVISGARSSATGHRLHAPGSAALRPPRPVLPFGPAPAVVGPRTSEAGQEAGSAGVVGPPASGVEWSCRVREGIIGLICRGPGHPAGNEVVLVLAAGSPSESLKFNQSGSQRATGVRTMRWPSGATGALSA